VTKFPGITPSGVDLPSTGRLVGTDLAGPTDYLYTAAQIQGGLVAAAVARQRLTAGVSVYIDPTNGNDTTGTGTIGAPFKTFAVAFPYAVDRYDLVNFTVTFQFVGTAFTEQILANEVVSVGGGNFVLDFSGGTLHTSGPCIRWKGERSGIVTVQNVDLASTGNSAIIVQDSTFLSVGDGVRFGTCGLYHVQAIDYGLPLLFTNYEIYGGANAHIVAQERATFQFYFPPVVTLTGTPAFTTAFAWALRGGFIYAGGTTFNGSATGPRFITDRSTIDTGNAGLSYFPGSSAGSGNGGGTYDFTIFEDDILSINGGPYLQNAVNDAAAQAAGVPVGAVYRNGSVLQMRVV